MTAAAMGRSRWSLSNFFHARCDFVQVVRNCKHFAGFFFVSSNEICEPLKLHTSRSWVIVGIS